MGISFISSYHARDNSSVLKFHNKHMYRKRLSNFEKIPSPNLRTQKWQEIRFNRAYHRIFSKMKLSPGRTAQHSDYLAKANIAPNADDYKFFIPFYVNNSQHANTIKENVNFLDARIHISPTLQTFDDSVPWVEEYNPIPNMFIPAEAIALENLRNQKNISRAAYYGTNKNYPDHINNERKQRNLNRNLSKFLKKLKSETPNTLHEISDDTKSLEHQPNKHDSTCFTNTSTNNSLHPHKRPHPSTENADDSPVAEPSTNTEKFFIHM
ncbi:hypothetical protein RhiirA5_423974 [Rhizophagus irregularis]|uniref:DUF8211 domain-containing protein n=1 Tax=Rhizophagus irregularis TaxID=588596 RepID=A0A2N0NX14_9GLOM|nr:hypothetical protein RhiirA5_430266 [Rhizophagus irregularis]PKC03305.1 hypothetical protein RhiirA5_423974 [Rhizophagus irregularis]